MKTKKLMCAAAIAMLAFTACKKNDHQARQNPANGTSQSSANSASRVYSGISVSNDLLFFRTISDYRDAMNFRGDTIKDSTGIYSERKIDEWAAYTKSIGHNSLLDNASSAEEGLARAYEDRALLTTLNVNGMLRISNFTIKVHPQDDRVYILQSSGDPSESDMAGLQALDVSLPNISAMNMSSSVIDILEKYQGDNSSLSLKDWFAEKSDESDFRTSSLFCGDNGCGSGSSSTHVAMNTQSPGNEGWMDCYVKYERAGVYFSLFWKVNSVSNTRTLYIHIDPYAYKKKCGYSVGPISYWGQNCGALSQSPHSNHFYSNVQPLNKFWLRTVFMAKRTGYPDYNADLMIKNGY